MLKHKKNNRINLLVLAFLAVGFGETIGQVLLIRELIVNFQGNELSIGIILANWMLMIALGSWGFGKIAHKIKPRRTFFALSILAFCILLPAQLIFARSVNNLLGISIGEIVGIFPIFYSSLLVVAPLCILNGFQFAFGCRILSETVAIKEEGVARIYIFEATGHVIGGVLFTYLMVHYLQALEIAIYAIMFNLIMALLLLKPWVIFKKTKVKLFSRSLSVFLAIAFLICIYFIYSGNIETIDEVSRSWQWQEQNLISSKDSVYGNIAITESNGQTNFFNNGLLMFSAPYPDIAYMEEISHFPMLFHPSPQNVLLIGDGAGGALEHILKHPISRLDYIELDQLMVQEAKKIVGNDVFEDPRLNIKYTEGRYFIQSGAQNYDVIIINLPPPSTLQLNRFYTEEFFEQARKILNEEGIISFALPASEAYMSREMLVHNRSIFKTVNQVFPEVLVIFGDWNLFIGSINSDIREIGPEIMYSRFKQRELETDLLTSGYFEYKLSADRITALLELYRENEGVKANKDITPVGTYYNLALWNAMFYPGLRGFFNWAAGLRLWWFLIPVSLLAIVPVLIEKFSHPSKRAGIEYGSIALVIATTGFTGMTLSIINLFSFQILSGHLYQKIGILVAAFMLGLALGGLVMNKIMGRIKKNIMAFLNIEIFIGLYAIAVSFLIAFIFNRIENFQAFPLPEAIFGFLNCSIGLLVGLEFPLANKINISGRRKTGPVAGTLYAADLTGSVLGAILTGVFLVPILGIINTCYLLAALKAAAIILIISLFVLSFKKKLEKQNGQ